MKKAVLPILVLLAAAAVAVVLIFSRPEPESRPLEIVEIPVEIITAKAETVTLTVSAQGTVLPQLKATVAAEVGGLVIQASEDFEAGNFVRKGDILLQIDPTDYKAAVAEAKANLRSAQTTLTQSKADAEQAIQDLKEVGVQNPSPLARREPQLEQARLRVDSAQAALDLTEKNLDRTNIRAPFDGLIIETLVDQGDVVANRGTPAARLYGTAIAEVELPLSRQELLLLTLPADPISIAADNQSKPKVTFKLGTDPHATEVKGWVDRLAGTSDPVTRLRMAIAIIEDPLDIDNAGSAAVPFGSFLSAEIEGKILLNAFRLPVVSLIGESRVRIVDEEGRLQERPITIAQRTAREIVVTAGLKDGDQVCLTPLKIFSPGMLVRPVSSEIESKQTSSEKPVKDPQNSETSS